jgi:hypothetical protein
VNEKNVVIFAGLALAAVVVFLYLKKQSANQAAYLNEPGLTSQPGIGATAQAAGSQAIGSIIGSFGTSLSGLISSGISSIGSGFSSQNSGSNEPGLETDDSYEQDYDSDDANDFNNDSTDYGDTFSGVNYFSSDDDADSYAV